MFNFFRKKHDTPAELFFHTDIHSHVIPGIDDGSPSADVSAKLIKRMKSWGLTRLIATPHVTESTFENTPEIMDKAMGTLKSVLQSQGIDIELSHSAEYRLDDLFGRQFADGNISPFPNDFLLVENSFIQEPWGLDETLFDLKVKGYSPILAHPERYPYYHSKKDRYKKLHNDGTLFQVNLLSLAGHYGRDVRRAAEYLIDQGMVDFIGTDLHNEHHADAIEAYLSSKDYRRDRDALQNAILNDTAFN